jgi:hypothetical protein
MDHESEYVFHSIEDIITFVQWVQANFDNVDEYEVWFGVSMDSFIPPEVICTRSHRSDITYFACSKCKAKFSTEAGLSVHDSVLHNGVKTTKYDNQFWKIINEEYKEEDDEYEPNSDEDSISDTD